MVLRQSDLKKIFYPRHIAIVGVSTGEYRFGGMSFLIKLQESGYAGNLYPINRKAQEIRGLKAYPDLISLPEVPDLAMVCVAAKLVPSILEQCASIGLKHIHILSSGFKETGLEAGKQLEERVAGISKDKGLLVIGPNCMGPYCPASNLTPWGAIPGRHGSLGIISQSGGLAQRLTEYTDSLGIGVAKAVSFGNATVLDSMDFLEVMAADEQIRIIAMYLEGVREGRKFMQIAKEVSRKKPIVLWKGGESEAGAATAASHTGAMSGHKELWRAFYRQSGVIPVQSMNEWVDTIMALSLLPAPKGKGVFVIGGGGGNSVAYADTCIREGLEVPSLSETTLKDLGRSVPLAGSIAGNPLDMWQTFVDAPYLAAVVKMGDRDPSVSMIIIDRMVPRNAFHMQDMTDPTPQTIEFVKARKHEKPIVFTVDSEGGDPDLTLKGSAIRTSFSNSGIPAYPSVRRAARSLSHLYRYHSRKKIR